MSSKNLNIFCFIGFSLEIHILWFGFKIVFVLIISTLKVEEIDGNQRY